MYTPKLKDENVRALYQLKLKVGKPMTELINEAVAQYILRITEKEEKSKK